MNIQKARKLFPGTVFLLFLSNAIYGQDLTKSKGKILEVYNITKTTYNNGDTIVVRLKNLTPYDRGFIIEAVALNKTLIIITLFIQLI